MQPVALQKEDIRKAVVVVIEDRNPGASVFDDVGLIQLAGNHFSGESRPAPRRRGNRPRVPSFLEGRGRTGASFAFPEAICESSFGPRASRAHITATSAASGTSPRSTSTNCAFPAADPECWFRARAIKFRARLDLGISGLERFGGQQFLFAVVEVASLAIDQAQFLVKVGFHRAVAALGDCVLQLSDRFGPVVSGRRDDTVICQRSRAVSRMRRCFLYGSVARHELARTRHDPSIAMRAPGKQRLAEVRIDRDCLPPRRDRFRGLGLLLKALTEQIPGHHVAGLQLNRLFEQAGRKLVTCPPAC